MPVIRIIGINLRLFLRIDWAVINIRFDRLALPVGVVLLRSLTFAPDKAVGAEVGAFEVDHPSLIGKLVIDVFVIVAAHESRRCQYEKKGSNKKFFHVFVFLGFDMFVK